MQANNDYVDLTAAAKLFPGKAHVAAVWRWCRRGIKARSGQRVRLEHVRAGGKLFTRPEWCEAFLKALAAADTEYFDARIQTHNEIVKTTADVVTTGDDAPLSKSRQRDIARALRSIELRKVKR